jgi:hypothetical protein
VDAGNGESWEGRQTDHAAGQDYFYLFVDDVFTNDPGQQWELKVTYQDVEKALPCAFSTRKDKSAILSFLHFQ